jgi:KipI family sensor histidine kinase inhibitor
LSGIGGLKDRANMGTMRVRISGDRMLIAVFGDEVDPAVNERVRRMAALVAALQHPAIEAVVPAYGTLGLQYDPDVITWAALLDLLHGCEQLLAEAVVPEARIVEIPVCYGDEFGPDLEAVAAHAGLAPEEVVRLHSGADYRIYAIGFAPGFCYLGGLDQRIHAPRLTTPRLHVPSGSVGIAGGQTGVYPLASPGGWQLIGRTPLRLFAPYRQPPIPYQPGDTIRFRPIAVEHFAHLAKEDER